MKKNKMLICLMYIAFMSFIYFTGCTGSNAGKNNSNRSITTQLQLEQKSDKKVILKVSHVLAATEPIHIELVNMAKRISKRSNGSMEIRVYPNSELGNNKDNLEQVSNGENLIVVADPGYMADYVPDYNIMTGAFLYDSYKDIQKIAESDWNQEMMKASSKKGIKVLAMDWYFGSRHIISGKVIIRPDDIKGMKIRIPPTKIWSETIKAMGGSPSILQWSEVYSGLAQGIVDAVEAPLSSMYVSRLYEAQNYVALTGHFRAVAGLEMSQNIFDSLSEEQKKILEEEVKTSGIDLIQAVVKSEEEFKVKMEAKGVKFNEVDTDAFKKACEVVYTKFPEWSPGLYERIEGIISK